MPTYYDAVLALIPILLVGVSAGLMFSGIETEAAVITGAGLATAVVGHAMFIRAPTDQLVQDADSSSPSVTSTEEQNTSPSLNAAD